MGRKEGGEGGGGGRKEGGMGRKTERKGREEGRKKGNQHCQGCYSYYYHLHHDNQAARNNVGFPVGKRRWLAMIPPPPSKIINKTGPK
jgi:hypothetical protein